MKFYSARQAIHDAYAIHMLSKGFEVNPLPGGTVDTDRLIWDSKDAGKVIAVVEALPDHLRAWCYWCYSPLGTTNQSWFRQLEVQRKARTCRAEADRLTDQAARLPERITRCKTPKRRAELEAMDTDQMISDAGNLEELADRLERSLRQPDPCAPFWNWLDEQIAQRAPGKIRKKTLWHVRDVCRASAYNYRQQVLTGSQKPLLSRKGICERFGVPVGNFERNYRGWVEWCLHSCDQLDKSSLPMVAEKLN